MSGLLTCCGITCFGSVLPLAGYLLAAPRTQGLGSATFHPRLYTCRAGPAGRRTCGPFLMPAHGLPTCPVCLLTLAASPFHSSCGTLTSQYA